MAKKTGFSKKVKFVLPFQGSFQMGAVGKAYSFRVTSRQIWPEGKRGPKTPVVVEIDNPKVYDWLIKFEEVSA